MRADEITQPRSLLLARWRRAVVPDVPEPLQFAPAETPAAVDVVTLRARFEAELAESVPASVAESVRRLLATAGAEDLLATLDVVEDVLDAALLSQRPETT